jgi:hypothetical protein
LNGYISCTRHVAKWQPNIAAQADVATALELSVGTEPGVVVVNAKALVEDARLGTTLVLNSDAALDLAMRLIGCVGRLRKLEIGERS